MYGPPGIAYVYLVYGMYDCLNVVVGPPGEPAAVLIRAVAPIDGTDLMRLDRTDRAIARRRAVDDARGLAIRARLAATADEALARGPGLVGAAFGVDRTMTGTDLFAPTSRLRIVPDAGAPDLGPVIATPRIGVGYAGDPWASVPWRLAFLGHPSVSGSRTAR